MGTGRERLSSDKSRQAASSVHENPREPRPFCTVTNGPERVPPPRPLAGFRRGPPKRNGLLRHRQQRGRAGGDRKPGFQRDEHATHLDVSRHLHQPGAEPSQVSLNARSMRLRHLATAGGRSTAWGKGNDAGWCEIAQIRRNCRETIIHLAKINASATRYRAGSCSCGSFSGQSFRSRCPDLPEPSPLHWQSESWYPVSAVPVPL